MKEAIKLYEQFKDMDFSDYEDTKEEDINFIYQLIDLYGVRNAARILASM